MNNVRIRLAEYDPAWPALFDREAVRIRAALGVRVLQLEHTGSTSVTGLSAKPVIDLLLVVDSSANEDAYLPSLEAVGYALKFREPEWYEHRLLKGPDTDVNLHVFSMGCEEVRRILAFRDWLRAHPDDRDRYERIKRALVRESWASVDDYARAKSEIVEEVLSRALEHNI